MREEDILTKELENVEREVRYLFESEVPFVLETVGALLKHSKNLLKRSSNIDKAPTSTSDRLKILIPLQLPNGVLKGGITVTGSRIVDGDIVIALHKVHNKSHATHLSHSSPWILSQVENASRFIAMATNELSELQFTVEEGDGNKTSISLLKNSLERLLLHLSRAKNEMTQNPSGLFPNSQSHLSKSFHPELPSDVVLEFHLFKARLIASVYSLSPSSSGATPAPDSFIGHTVSYQGSKVTVTDFWEGEYTVPNYQEAVSSMDEVISMCTNLRDKTAAILSLR